MSGRRESQEETVHLVADHPSDGARARMVDTAFLLCGFLYLAVGFSHAFHQELVFPSDAANYWRQFEFIRANGLRVGLDDAGKDAFFVFLAWLIGHATSSFGAYRGLMWIAFACTLYVAFFRVAGVRWATLSMFAVWFYFPFVNYGMNAVRQGLAMAVLSLVVARLATSGKRWSAETWLLAALAAAVHWSAAVFVLVLLANQILRPKLKFVLAIWLTCAILYATALNEKMLSQFIREYSLGSVYTTDLAGDIYTRAGFRWDFLGFSIVLGVALLIIARLRGSSRFAVCLYFEFNAVYLLLGFVYFSDRVAAFGWFMAPLLMLLAWTRADVPVSREVDKSAIPKTRVREPIR